MRFIFFFLLDKISSYDSRTIYINSKPHTKWFKLYMKMKNKNHNITIFEMWNKGEEKRNIDKKANPI